MPFQRLVRFALLVVLAPLALRARADAPPVAPGLPAPAMAVKTWLKGTPVENLEPGRTYVVEFWATWCGPCLESIPHLTSLARANPDVTFVGISVWEEDREGSIRKFVDSMGKRMDYHVGYSGNKDGMARTWMDAAAQNGIPTAFVVKDGTVMWIGHPMELDEPLARIKAGAFDLAAHRAIFEKRAEKNRRAIAANDAVKAARLRFDTGDRSGAKTVLDKAVADFPEDADAARSVRFDWLAIENPKAWDEKARAMAASGQKADLQALRHYALDHAEEPARARTAKRAMALTLEATRYQDLDTLFYGFNVYHAMKDRAADLDVTNRILALLPKSAAKDNAELHATVLKRKMELEAKSRN